MQTCRVFFFAFFVCLTTALAQESATPSATPARLVRLRFVPPPVAGTISLGIYDANGKLVRVLHREEKIAAFTVGHDALETIWDGTDEKDHALPAGRYHARGFLVGDVQVEGIAYFFNDWVTDEESPHLAHITRLEMQKGFLALEATLADGKSITAQCDPATAKLRLGGPVAAASTAQPNNLAPVLPGAISLAPGRNGTWWAILPLPNEPNRRAVAQVAGGDAETRPDELRRLTIAPNEPQPVGIAASLSANQIFLLEESTGLQRVRSLSLLAPAAPAKNGEAVSDWKIDFLKSIVAHENFSVRDGKPILQPNEQPPLPEKIVQKLKANPLERERTDKVELRSGFDENGSFLCASDGLPLRTVSENADLKRILIARHDEQALDFFQDDGAVVEQFRLTNLEQMFAFDCGEFDLK